MSICDELFRDLEFAEEVYGEILAQYRSECAHYGDAWPGAAIQVSDARQLVEKLKKELDLITEPVLYDHYDDIDF